VTTVLLDTHVVQWWSAEPDRLSREAAGVVTKDAKLSARPGSVAVW